MRPVVWVLKEQMRQGDTGSQVMDYSPAERYGELRFITTHDIPLHTGSSAGRRWAADVDKFLQEYDDKKDYIVATGQPMAIMLTGFMLGAYKLLPRFLVWRREENNYLPFDPLSIFEAGPFTPALL